MADFHRGIRLFTNGSVVETVGNWNDCKIFLDEDIDFKLSQFLSNDVAKAFR